MSSFQQLTIQYKSEKSGQTVNEKTTKTQKAHCY